MEVALVAGGSLHVVARPVTGARVKEGDEPPVLLGQVGRRTGTQKGVDAAELGRRVAKCGGLGHASDAVLMWGVAHNLPNRVLRQTCGVGSPRIERCKAELDGRSAGRASRCGMWDLMGRRRPAGGGRFSSGYWRTWGRC
jgi:hypothetical protein